MSGPGAPRPLDSDADRERLVALLREHYAVGLFGLDELDRRVGVVLSAQYLDAQHQPDPAVQLVQPEQAHRVVLAQQPDQPVAIGVGGQRPRGARTGHRYPAGRTTTAVP